MDTQLRLFPWGKVAPTLGVIFVSPAILAMGACVDFVQGDIAPINALISSPVAYCLLSLKKRRF